MQGGQSPATASTTEIVDALNDLLQLDHDAIGSYDIAIEKLEDRDHASQIAGFRQDHERHIRDLNAMITQLGGTPTNEPHKTAPLKQGMQSLGAAGGDKGILVAWRTNELQVRTKYDGYASKAVFWPNDVKRLIDQNALDEERHYEWVTNLLKRMGVPVAEEAEQQVINTVREKAEQVGALADKARDAVGTVRERASGAMDSARERATGMVDSARERASSTGESARGRAADGLEMAADRLNSVASDQAAAGGARARAAGVAQGLAGGMSNAAGYLRTGDTDALRRDVEAEVRANPVRSVLTVFAIGFVIGRILR